MRRTALREVALLGPRALPGGGAGTQARTRTLQRRQTGGGACRMTTQSWSCNAISCPVKCNKGSEECRGTCSLTCGTGAKRITAIPDQDEVPNTAAAQRSGVRGCIVVPVLQLLQWPPGLRCWLLGRLGQWLSDCGTGFQTKTRSLTQPQNGRASCGVSSRYQSCDAFICLVNCAEWRRGT